MEYTNRAKEGRTEGEKNKELKRTLKELEENKKVKDTDSDTKTDSDSDTESDESTQTVIYKGNKNKN